MPTAAELAAWESGLAECAELRCEGIAARIAPEDRARGLLLEALDDRAVAGDGPGAATLLGAVALMLGRLPGSLAEMRRYGPALVRVPGFGNQRGVALALHTWLAPRLDPLGRCPSSDPCPWCREGEPCPLDTWRTSLAASAIAPDEAKVTAFWNTTASGATTAKGAGRGYLAMRGSAPALADAVLRLCLDFHRSKHDRLTAALLAEQVWRTAGCSDPAITEVRVRTIASGGRPADLAAALGVCHAVLANRAGSTDSGWTSLETTSSQLAALQRRRSTGVAVSHGPVCSRDRRASPGSCAPPDGAARPWWRTLSMAVISASAGGRECLPDGVVWRHDAPVTRLSRGGGCSPSAPRVLGVTASVLPSLAREAR